LNGEEKDFSYYFKKQTLIKVKENFRECFDYGDRSDEA
jgi:hypothetical protein